ncbi:hypothetical protein ACIF85_40225 [Streptomyces sp. NPDC086033]
MGHDRRARRTDPAGSGIDGSVRLWHPDVRARTAAVRRPARPLGGPRGNS